MSEIVLRHGGTIDKFVGDAVVTFWGAPIARPDDAERALKAAIAMQEGGDLFAGEKRADDAHGHRMKPNPRAVPRVLAKPERFYLNIHTTAYPDGARRAQLG